MSQNAKKKHAICDEIDLRQMIFVTFRERRPTVRLGDLIRNGCGRFCEHENNTARTRLQPPDLQS